MKPPVLALDLDGTLVDTAGDLVATLNVILERHGLSPRPFAAARNTVGHGARNMIEAAFRGAGREADDATFRRLLDEFIEHYRGRLALESRPFPGATAALDRFAGAGWRLAICTNKLEALSLDLLGQLGLADRFAAICGQDSFAWKKPDPRHLTETVRVAGGNATAAVMVGDSATDIDAAKAAGVPVVAVTFGYSDAQVRDLGPDAVIDHFDDLWDAVASVTRRRASAPAGA